MLPSLAPTPHDRRQRTRTLSMTPTSVPSVGPVTGLKTTASLALLATADSSTVILLMDSARPSLTNLRPSTFIISVVTSARPVNSLDEKAARYLVPVAVIPSLSHY